MFKIALLLIISTLLFSNVEIIRIIDKSKIVESKSKRKINKRKISKKKIDKIEILNLKIYNPKIGEVIHVVIKGGVIKPKDKIKLDKFFRDFHDHKVKKIDSRLYYYLAKLFSLAPTPKYIILNSAYRTEKTQDLLRKKGYKPAKYSQHLKGKAIDFSIKGSNLSVVYKIGMSLKMGGIAYYPKKGYIHIDTGPFRTW